ncbi:thioredoxin [Candidatus Woesearchaeota archaeon]|nr:thioredoxin [Candidatus Woesearchaeota archaeon]
MPNQTSSKKTSKQRSRHTRNGGKIMEINQENFEKEVLKSDKPVVVDYWAPWCGPCKMIAPIFEKLSAEITTAKFGKIDVDQNTSLAQQQGIMGIPCIVIYKNGEEAERITGYQTEAQLRQKIMSVLE